MMLARRLWWVVALLGSAFGSTAGASTQLFLGIANAPGANGSYWRSELQVVNVGSDEVACTLGFGGVQLGAISLEPEGSYLTRDVLGAHEVEGVGTLTLACSSDFVLALARTYTVAATGTYGQLVPPARVDDAVFPFLPPSADYRANLGLYNPSAVSLEAAVSSGNGATELRVPGGAFVQSPVSALLPPGAAFLAVTGLASYLSVVDNRTNDATTFLAQTPGKRFLFPGVAHVEGEAGTSWRSDLALYNLSGVAVGVALTVEGRSTEVEVPAHSTRLITDVVQAVAGGVSASGVLEVSSPSRVVAHVRTYTDGGSGTFGQRVPEADLQTLPRVFLLAREDADFRSNLGLYLEEAGTILLEELGSGCSTALDLPAGFTQVGHILQRLGLEAGVLEARDPTGSVRFDGYLSVVDNHTGDATTVPGLLRTSRAVCPPDPNLPNIPAPRPWGYFGYHLLPDPAEEELAELCGRTPGQLEEYYQQSDAEGQALSASLEAYIREWWAGRQPALLPDGLLPPSMDNEKTHSWTLLRPEEVDPREQWFLLPAHDVAGDFCNAYHVGSDEDVTYLRLFFVAPLGAELLVEGDFPHARFLDYQVAPPFDPRHPYTGNIGTTEVSIVDVDIEPDPGHSNPFRVGADRTAPDRHYHLAFDLRAGDVVELNADLMASPAFRAPGNRRVGGPFECSGPLGQGVLVPSTVWLRYYAIDRGLEPFGGVAYPKALLRLSTGETFWLQCDFERVTELAGRPGTPTTTPPQEPWDFMGAYLGWMKIFDLWQNRAIWKLFPYTAPWGPRPAETTKESIRQQLACYAGRGPELPAPGSLEPSPTSCNYINYLVRPVQLGFNMLYAVTGKLPLTPATRDGDEVMTRGEARFWSLCRYADGANGSYNGLNYGCLMDEEVVTDEGSRYVIVMSRPEDRPANARAECGVSWMDSGPEAGGSMVIRWLSVRPDHFLAELSPSVENIPWAVGDWPQPAYDPNLVGHNVPGAMGAFHPLVHYLNPAQFEALGCPVDPASVPAWDP